MGTDINLQSSELNLLEFDRRESSHFDEYSNINTIPNQYRILEIDSESFYRKWENYVNRHSESHIYCHPLWFKALEHEFNTKGNILVCIDENENIKGVLPLLPTLGLPLKLNSLVTSRRYSSLPRTPLGGLLTDDSTAKIMLLNAAIVKVNQKRKTFFQLKSYSSDISSGIERIKQFNWRASYILNVPEYAENIKFGNKTDNHKVKWSVNKAKSLGIKVRELNSINELRVWYKLYLETMRYHTVPARPFRFFEFLWNNLKPKGLLTILIAENDLTENNQLLSGSMFLHFNKTFFYSFNGRSKSGLALHANDLILWEAIHLAAKLGYKNFDMGEASINNSGLIQFKTKWGCGAHPIYHYYYPSNKKVELNNLDVSMNLELRKLIWRKLPLFFTEQWGILTNRFL